MRCPHNAHVALVDGERFAVLQNKGTLFEPQLQAVCNPVLDPTNFSAGVKHQDDGGQRKGETDLNELAHGAAAAEWLNGRAISGELNDLIVVADPKTLGEMRRHYHKQLKSCIIAELDKAIAGEPIPVIEKAIANA